MTLRTVGLLQRMKRKLVGEEVKGDGVKVSERIALVHRAGTRPNSVWWGNVTPVCFEGCVSWWVRSGIL
jgi:hypothetical protein